MQAIELDIHIDKSGKIHLPEKYRRICLALCMWHGDWLFRHPLVPKIEAFWAQNHAQVGAGVPVPCFP